MGDIILPQSQKSHFRGVVVESLLLINIVAKSVIRDATPDALESVQSHPKLMRQAGGEAAELGLQTRRLTLPRPPPPPRRFPQGGRVGAERSVGCRDSAGRQALGR